MTQNQTSPATKKISNYITMIVVNCPSAFHSINNISSQRLPNRRIHPKPSWIGRSNSCFPRSNRFSSSGNVNFHAKPITEASSPNEN